MSLASLIVSIVAAAVAGASALFARAQIAEMRRQFLAAGPEVTVTASTGIPYGPLGTDRLQTGVTATNRGRGEVMVTNWGFTLSGPGNNAGVVFGTMHVGTYGPSVPCTLSGLSELTWFLDRDGLRQAAAEAGLTIVKPIVDLGDGSRV